MPLDLELDLTVIFSLTILWRLLVVQNMYLVCMHMLDHHVQFIEPAFYPLR
jgi:hypothetical protein